MELQDMEIQVEVTPSHEVAKTDQHLMELFRQYDRDGDVRISIGELRATVNSPEFNRDELPNAFVQNLMNMSDKDNDRHINMQEFVDMIHRSENGNIFSYLIPQYIKKIVSKFQNFDATDGQYQEGCEFRHFPFFIISVSIAQIVLYSCDKLAGHTLGTGPIATELIYNPNKRQEAWRFLTYIFIHKDWSHLVGNLFMQLVLGIPLEMLQGWWRVLVVYMVGAFAGSLSSSFTDPSEFLAGASSSFYAIFAAFLVSYNLNGRVMEYGVIQFLIYLCIYFRIIYNNNYSEVNEEVSVAAHFGGGVAGFLVSLVVLRNLDGDAREKKLSMLTLFFPITLMTIAHYIRVS